MTTKRNRSLPNFTIRGKRKAKAAPPPACPVVRPKMRQRDRFLLSRARDLITELESRFRVKIEWTEDLQARVSLLRGEIDEELKKAEPSP